MPLENCEGMELRDKSRPIIDENDETLGVDYTGVKVNCGNAKKADWWVIVGPKAVLSVRSDNVSKQNLADDFTAPRCEECHRTDGGHSETCSHRNMISFATYLAFAKAQKLRNPNSHARKMELKRDRDEEVREWIEAEQGRPDAEKGALFNAEPEPKPRKMRKLRLVEESSYEAGL